MPGVAPPTPRPYVEDSDFELWLGDSFAFLAQYRQDESVDAIVTSPPYGDARAAASSSTRSSAQAQLLSRAVSVVGAASASRSYNSTPTKPWRVSRSNPF